MWGYDGQTFTTIEQFIAYLQQKFGNSYLLNITSINDWGKDLLGGQVYYNGIAQTGSYGAQLAEDGFASASEVIELYDADPVSFSENTFAQLAKIKETQEAVVQGNTYTNTAISLGTSQSSAGNVLTMTRPVSTSNGTVVNKPAVTLVEEVEDPTVPGTFSYLGTLSALGWLPLPTWVAAVAPALGVALGAGIYDLSPNFWNNVSQRLLPHAYVDGDIEATGVLSDILKMPITIASDILHAPLDAIEALRQAFIDEGVYITEPIITPTVEIGDILTNVTSSRQMLEALIDAAIANMVNPSASQPSYAGDRPYYAEALRMLKNNIPALQTGYAYALTKERTYSGNTNHYYQIVQIPVAAFENKEVLQTSVSTESFSPSTIGTYVQIPGASSYPLYPTCVRAGWSGYHIDNPTITIDTAYTSPLSNRNTSSRIGGFTVIDSGSTSPYTAYAIGFNTVPGGGVDGTTLEPNATYPTDTTKNLGEIYPNWDANKISVLTNPQASTFADGTKDWYPVSLSNTNYANNTDVTSSTQTQTDSQAGTNTDSAQLNQIAQALQELTQTLTESGVLNPNPTIPSDPNGNTPTPTPPVITGAGSDLIAIYNPTKTEIQAFNQFLWDLDPTNLVNWQKVIQNPIDAIISLHMIYVTPITGASQNIKCGYVQTTVSSKVVTNQYVDIDCGTVDVDEYFHNIWDYIATEIQIYLPFIGIIPLHVSDIMNSTIRVRYRVDVYTGTCLAQIIVLKGNSLATLYTFTGNCAVTLPLSGGSFSNIMSTLIVMGGLVISGNPGTAATYGLGRASRGELKQNIQRSGNIGANAGAMGIRTPYLIITRKKPLDAYLYQEQYGFPANKTVVLGNMHGYTRVKDIHLAGIPCTDDELEMIERLLKEGVIIN